MRGALWQVRARAARELEPPKLRNTRQRVARRWRHGTNSRRRHTHNTRVCTPQQQVHGSNANWLRLCLHYRPCRFVEGYASAASSRNVAAVEAPIASTSVERADPGSVSSTCGGAASTQRPVSITTIR
eukprot:scaffold230729_cov26-Tisochrysis_lutea.AAC.1